MAAHHGGDALSSPNKSFWRETTTHSGDEDRYVLHFLLPINSNQSNLGIISNYPCKKHS